MPASYHCAICGEPRIHKDQNETGIRRWPCLCPECVREIAEKGPQWWRHGLQSMELSLELATTNGGYTVDEQAEAEAREILCPEMLEGEE